MNWGCSCMRLNKSSWSSYKIHKHVSARNCARTDCPGVIKTNNNKSCDKKKKKKKKKCVYLLSRSRTHWWHPPGWGSGTRWPAACGGGPAAPESACGAASWTTLRSQPTWSSLSALRIFKVKQRRWDLTLWLSFALASVSGSLTRALTGWTERRKAHAQYL